MNQKVWKITATVLQIILSLLLVLAGSAKFWASGIWGPKFEDWGYPGGFLYITGALEILAPIMFWIPKTRYYGLILAALIMLSAMATHLIHAEYREILSPIIYLVLIAAITLIQKRILDKKDM